MGGEEEEMSDLSIKISKVANDYILEKLGTGWTHHNAYVFNAFEELVDEMRRLYGETKK